MSGRESTESAGAFEGMPLRSMLEHYRAGARSEREKGACFERLVRTFLAHDDVQQQHYSAVLPWGAWAEAQGWSAADTGIDLVATLADGSGYAAVQCKFYQPDHVISKPDIDSFISAAGNDVFAQLIIADTSARDFGQNARETLDRLSKPWHRIGLADLEDSRIDWARWLRSDAVHLAAKKALRDDQRAAVDAVRTGLEGADRGKLIMACGTGKTFTSLRLAEEMVGPGGCVLFMVPSLALMSQSVRAWCNDAREGITAFSVCSDRTVGKRRADSDSLIMDLHDLAFPATTDAARLAAQVADAPADRMTVVFATYHSIGVLGRAQKEHGLPAFDLVICDEAHRTTGVTLKGEDESAFVRIHSNDHIAARKRLYMTATPRIFADAAKKKADAYEADLVSMDDAATFGGMLFHRGFGWAVENGLLTDYKVVVLAVDEAMVSAATQNRLKEGAELTLDDATKIVGCYRALTKSDLSDTPDPGPMRRALAFCQSIKSSEAVAEEFTRVVADYVGHQGIGDDVTFRAEVLHVDGTFGARTREERLNWLREGADDSACRILSNVRVLSEGVDVPALDAILFLHPRNSQIDVVQSVGRVMRRAEGKDLGYVILPVAIPPQTKPEAALNDNARYRVVWQVLNALRAHDERLDARINQARLGEDISDRIECVHIADTELDAMTAVVDDFSTSRTMPAKAGIGGTAPARPALGDPGGAQYELALDAFTRAIMARIVDKCGTRDYWENWAADIAAIAQTHITRITTIVAAEGPERAAFDAFVAELRDDLNPSVSEAEAIEMLAQHLITRPVFEALFKGSRFSRENPVSKAMETVLGQLHEHNLAKEQASLARFYASVERRAEGVVTAQGRQRLITELYDRFFRAAFPRLAERLGIVYTPVEVVDFIIGSVNDVLKAQFGQTLGSKGVHILDPFTGTGTFITRLLQSGLITPGELAHKYAHEIHANEIVLLAYYIAAVNIETVYHERAYGALTSDAAPNAPYEPFRGILLTDTFQMYEHERDMVANLLPDNSERRTRQKELDIRVIMGNPPYSAGQKSANDNAANLAYAQLDARIRDSYAACSTATNKNALYDSYIRAFRWASDLIGNAGVMAFVTGSAWVERSFADGMRKCLAEEFSDLYVFHLRGDIRKNMLSKGTAGEGQNIFGSASMTGTSIAVLVKTPDATEQGRIHFHDIGDDLDRDSKLSIIRDFGSIGGITQAGGWTRIAPDANNDWLDQVDRSFERFPVLGDKRGAEDGLFAGYSSGVKTQRDAWAYNASRTELDANMRRMINFYNAEVDRYVEAGKPGDVDGFVNTDPKAISWTHSLKDRLRKGENIEFDGAQAVVSVYRPFTKQWLHFDRRLNERVYQMPRLFPDAAAQNRVIQVSGIGARAGFSALMSDHIPCLDTIEKGQCFPLYLYEAARPQGGLFGGDEADHGFTRRAAITDAGLAQFQAAYPGQQISKEDLFHYIYGLLHAPDYRTRFKNNLAKGLPRIPPARRFEAFAAFRDAGRVLGDLHVNFERADPYMVTFREGDHRLIPEAQADPVAFYRVKKMKFGGRGREKDKTTVIYNARITMENIPPAAYDYIVNGKAALDWVMERQVVKTDTASGILNDANDCPH